MRCKACNKILEDSELTKKGPNNDFLDMCNYCLYAAGAVEVDSDNIVEYYQNEVFTNDDDYDTLF
jgi:hypothetical protein